jgi:hypothetical protein
MAASSASACPASDSASIRATASAASLSRPCTWPWPTAPPASRTVARVTVISPRLKGAPVAPARPRTITVPISGGRSTSWAGTDPPRANRTRVQANAPPAPWRAWTDAHAAPRSPGPSPPVKSCLWSNSTSCAVVRLFIQLYKLIGRRQASAQARPHETLVTSWDDPRSGPRSATTWPMRSAGGTTRRATACRRKRSLPNVLA